MITCGITSLAFGLFSYVLYPAVSTPRDVSRFINVSNELKQIALALHYYHDTFGAFPPAYLADENGKPMHSWRVLILPFLEEHALYDRYDFSQPWDGPENLELLPELPECYEDPRLETDDPGLTTCQVIAAPGAVFDPEFGPVKFPDITDGTPNTILVIENLGRPVPWTKPVDMNWDDVAAGVPLYNAPRDIVVVVMVDGSVRRIQKEDLSLLKSAATRGGGEVVPSR
ncbi:hypothetical protein DSM3645_08236 [Blastopirellula marina DSM 3645]|uniref:DUF1559 domain-containing protein n=1 Tax=Blastopirellula marina DSM 3645 TaxID=314230 RepID=A4A106_9BACT|nr:hypothetical protein DSM3645_08236 [Blastopirellula marina DSM 3645]